MFRFVLLASLAASPAAAQASFQDTAAIDRAVTAFTGRPIGQEGGARTPVDTRLKLAACPMVAISWRGANHDSVVVSCSGPDWRVYVPVVMPAVVAVQPTAIVPATPAPKAEIVIKRGDPVTIEAGGNGFSITRDGVAMSDGTQGGRFLVNVDGAKKPVQAVAVEAGRATLPGWTN